jgi:F-type H+-transporting ATPase subunit epsilon
VPLQVELVSPERILWSGEAEMVIARTTDGEIAFLNGHAPFIGALDIGGVRVMPADGSPEVQAAVHGGFVEVSDNRVTLLSDVAELANDIDVARAERALAEAERAMNANDAEAEARLRRARLRVDLGRR